VDVAREATVETKAAIRLPRLSLAQLWSFVAVTLPALATLAFPPSSIDLAYHLRTGDLMLESGALPRTDPFSFTAQGQPWLDQQWGSQVLLAGTFRAGGWAALGALRLGLTALLFFLIYKAVRAAGADRRRAAWLTLGSFAVSLGGLIDLRPQLFGMVLFALVLWILAGRQEQPGRLWMIPVATAIWSNLHGSYFLAPLLVLLAWIDDRSHGSTRARKTLLIAALSLAATVANPFGLLVWPYAWGVATHPWVSEVISEWQPPTLDSVEGSMFFLSAALVVAFLARRVRPTPWPVLLTLGAFLGMGLLAIRGTIWWGLVLAPVLARLVAARPSERQPRDEPSMANTGIAAVIVLATVAGFLPWLGVRSQTAPPTRVVSDAPYEMTAALNDHLGPGDRMFNPQIWGSWFIFALPQHPVFVDSRIEVFPEEVWDDHDVVSTGREGWQRVLDRWGVDVVVLHRFEQEELIPRIRRDPGWKNVYEDTEGLVFVRIP
jgi:hypothetical protein